MGIPDGTGWVNHEDGWCANEKEALDLEIFCCHPGTFIAQNKIWQVIVLDVFFNQHMSIWNHDQDFRIQVFKFLIVMPQLRHVIGAMYSRKPNIEYQ